MILTAKTRYNYVPAFSGNKNLKTEDRVVCEIIRPTVEDRNGLFSMDVERELTAAATAEKKAAVTFKRRMDVSRILRRHVGTIKNLEVRDEDGRTVKIKDGEALAECTAYGVAALVEELCQEVISDRISEEEKKI